MNRTLNNFIRFNCEETQYQCLNIIDYYVKIVATFLEGVAMDAYNSLKF